MNSICPSCESTYTEILTECPECQFSYHLLDQYYETQRESRKKPVEAKLLTDRAGVLNVNERKQCKSMLIKFTQRLPGLYYMVYLDSSRSHEEADSKSLWLLNRSNISDVPEEAHPQYGIMLYIDANKKAAAMSFGDGLAPYLKTKDTFQFLKAGHTDLYRGQYLKAVQNIVKRTQSHLSRKCPTFNKESA